MCRNHTEIGELVVCQAVSRDQAGLSGRASTKMEETKENGTGHFCFQSTSYTDKLYSLENYSKRQLVAPGDAGLCYEIPIGAYQKQNACFAMKERKVVTRTELPTAQNPFPVGSLNHLRVSEL